MGEVGEVRPEKPVESSTAAASVTTTEVASATTTTTPSQQNGDIQNGVCKADQMDVDTEDDSQVSSSENGLSSENGSEMTTNGKKDEISSSNSKIANLKENEDSLASAPTEEDEEEADLDDNEAHSVNSEISQENTKDSVTKEKASDDCEEDDEDGEDEESRSSSGKKNGSVNGRGEGEGEGEIEDEGGNDESQDAPSEVPTSQGDDDEEEEDDEEPMEVSQSETNDEDSQESGKKVEAELTEKAKAVVCEKATTNGAATVAEKKLSVDDVHVIASDDEEPPVSLKKADRSDEKMEVDKEDSVTAKKDEGDDDNAVIIGSDSETEPEIVANEKGPKSIANDKDPLADGNKLKKPAAAAASAKDDDDDCVVIDDDDDDDKIESQTVPKRQRKSAVKVRDFAAFGGDDDITEVIDDDSPPSKKQKINNIALAPQPNQIGQITIKDARSLMPPGTSEAAQKTFQQHFAQTANKSGSLIITQTSPGSAGNKNSPAAGLPAQNVYPVNIRTAGSGSLPPKLVPVSSPIATLPNISNANLLPGLTDDMFVLEAPSFIVPYIYEKPPSDNLREIVTKIETEFSLNKEDEKENEEFDLTKVINKDGNDADKKNKKKKEPKNGDDSWGESDDSGDDDDDESDTEPRTKILIKEVEDDLTALKSAIKPASALAAGGTTATGLPKTADSKTDNYFESPLGKFFMDIGIGLVQENVQTDLIRIQKRRLRKLHSANEKPGIEGAIVALSGNLEASKKRNAQFKFPLKRCEFCNFKTESALSMAQHYTYPHMNGVMYKCNFCAFEIRNSQEIIFHMEALHNIKGKIEKGPSYHACSNCPYEDNGKSKLARHAIVCAKKYRPDVNLAPPQDWEAPAKIPRIKPRHGLVGTATAYQAMAAQAAAQKAALASIQLQQQQRNAAPLAPNNMNSKQFRGRPQTVTKNSPNGGGTVMRTAQGIRPQPVILPNNYQIQGGQLIQSPQTNNTKKSAGQPSISITPLPRQTNAQTASQPAGGMKMPQAGIKPGQSPNGNKASFVICEICDGYIKDLEQLRNHMQWMHKVKIHPKMIHNRPPLNCQKCQFRFFTDQGLERHLLGSHGLVTSSMQEAANKGKDAGRCPLCGRMYQWKLLNHVSRDHYMTLKPAHLSYKCTVCTATFGMYKQFENHVYTAHSTVAKKAMDGKRNVSSSSAGSSSANNSRNESLLKPLKINDEITIIPQPSSKSRNSSNKIESHVID